MGKLELEKVCPYLKAFIDLMELLLAILPPDKVLAVLKQIYAAICEK